MKMFEDWVSPAYLSPGDFAVSTYAREFARVFLIGADTQMEKTDRLVKPL
jgi:hypothetical protein